MAGYYGLLDCPVDICAGRADGVIAKENVRSSVPINPVNPARHQHTNTEVFHVCAADVVRAAGHRLRRLLCMLVARVQEIHCFTIPAAPGAAALRGVPGGGGARDLQGVRLWPPGLHLRGELAWHKGCTLFDGATFLRR